MPGEWEDKPLTVGKYLQKYTTVIQNKELSKFNNNKTTQLKWNKDLNRYLTKKEGK